MYRDASNHQMKMETKSSKPTLLRTHFLIQRRHKYRHTRKLQCDSATISFVYHTAFRVVTLTLYEKKWRWRADRVLTPMDVGVSSTTQTDFTNIHTHTHSEDDRTDIRGEHRRRQHRPSWWNGEGRAKIAWRVDNIWWHFSIQHTSTCILLLHSFTHITHSHLSKLKKLLAYGREMAPCQTQNSNVATRCWVV